MLACIVKVERTTDDGRFFWFLTKAWDKMVGSKLWDLQVFIIEQSGSMNWAGRVTAVRNATGDSYGRRDQGSDSGQWAADNTILYRGKCVWLCIEMGIK